ncbi:hypothetical protein A5778_04020 [Mycolicibacterium monacense]|nr:hypothetical protein A5778_04020 [Mycolicibacterium monacense]
MGRYGEDMADNKGFHFNRVEADDNLARASATLEAVLQTDLDTLSPAEQIAYAQARATMAVGQALLAQIAQQDQPPLP